MVASDGDCQRPMYSVDVLASRVNDHEGLRAVECDPLLLLDRCEHGFPRDFVQPLIKGLLLGLVRHPFNHERLFTGWVNQGQERIGFMWVIALATTFHPPTSRV